MSTVAAISTPMSSGGISVIRISGEDSRKVAKAVFHPVSRKTIDDMQGYTCCYGKIFDGENEIDDGILTLFVAPKSYTGEDVVEISCHGGLYVTKIVLRAIIRAGAEPAAPGEFTKRAYLNGKLTLTEAEAVMDIISSQGESAHKSSVAMHEGALYKRIHKISDRMISILGELAAWVDYPDDDVADVDENSLLKDLGEILKELKDIESTYDAGRILREGVETAIVGRPNVGKSTLMNLLTGYERSIVTEIAGTTRDIVEESVRIGDVVLKLCDTAGIRKTEDAVENIGVDLAYKRLDRAELILAVFDYSEELQHEDFMLTEKLQGKNVIAVINKSDKPKKLDLDFINENYPENVMISAKNNEGIALLDKKILEVFKTDRIDTSAGVIANERQKKCVDMAIASLENAVGSLEQSETLDAVTVLVDEAENYLLELTGERITNVVVDEVFSHFCVGK